MWNRKKEEPPAPKPASPVPSPSDLAREGIPISTAPTRVSEPGSAAAIGKSVVVKGQIYGREDLYVDGEVEGTIEVQEHHLTVGPNGRVHAGIKARQVTVRGTVHGDVLASDKIEIRRDAKLVGDLKTARIVIEDGAYFKGSIDIVKPEVARPAPAAAAKPAASPPPEKLEAPRSAVAGSTPSKP